MGNVIPVTAIVAVIIFLVREMMEAERRRSADIRKKKAFRKLVAEECEKNNWTIKSLDSTLKDIISKKNTISLSISKNNYELERIFFEDVEGGSVESWPIPTTHSGVFSRLLVEIAGLDEILFDLACKSYADLAEVLHVRDMLLSFIADKKFELLEGLAEKYGRTQLAEAKESLSTLYKECTGTDLENHKLRSYT